MPLAGPVVAIQKRDRQERRSSNQDGIVPPAFVYTLLGSVGVAQLFGIGMVTAGALVPSRPVRERLATVRIVPLVSPNTVGLTVSGAL